MRVHPGIDPRSQSCATGSTGRGLHFPSRGHDQRARVNAETDRVHRDQHHQHTGCAGRSGAREGKEAGFEQLRRDLRQQSRCAEGRDNAAGAEKPLRHHQTRWRILLQDVRRRRPPANNFFTLLQRLRPASGSEKPVRRRRADLY